jgi:hypothetical protein
MVCTRFPRRGLRSERLSHNRFRLRGRATQAMIDCIRGVHGNSTLVIVSLEEKSLAIPLTVEVLASVLRAATVTWRVLYSLCKR